MNEKWNKVLDIALEEFDFIKVHKVMEFLNWTWGNNDKSPSIYQMINTVKELAEDAVSRAEKCEETCYSMTGGFCVEANSENYYIEINFIVEHFWADETFLEE